MKACHVLKLVFLTLIAWRLGFTYCTATLLTLCAQLSPWLSQLSLSVGQTEHIVYTQQHHNKSMLTHSSG